MKGRQIILGEISGRQASALVVDGVLEDLLIDSDAMRPGAIYVARADRPMKGQGGMFVQTPDGAGFLRAAKGIAPGEMLLVQVTGYAEPGKAPPVTTRLLFKSRYCIVTPDAPGVNLSRSIREDEERVRIFDAIADCGAEEAGLGLILRSACEGASEEDIAADVEAMLGLTAAILDEPRAAPEKLLEGPGPHDLAQRDWTGDIATDGLEDWIDMARTPREALPGGASFWVEPTRALVAVDVNTGGDSSPAAGQKANFAAAKALPRALRVRGLGGQIVIDFAPMPKKDRRGLEAALRAAFRADDLETSLVGWTPLGHYELNRKRARAALHEVLA